MTEKEIIEGNKLIAEFVGWKYNSETANHGIRDNCWIRKHEVVYELKYHSSWDWLMPVVEKIESITNNSISINKNNIRIHDAGDIYIVNISHNEDGYTISRYLDTDFDYTPIKTEKQQLSKIESVFLAVTEFIKWYNSQK